MRCDVINNNVIKQCQQSAVPDSPFRIKFPSTGVLVGFSCPRYEKYLSLLAKNVCYAPGLKGPPGASSVWIVRPSVRPFVRPSVRLSVRNSVPLLNKVQYLKFGWLYSNQTWTVSTSKGCSHFTDITCPWGGAGSKCWT